MNRKERAQIVREYLEELFPDPPIPLKHKDPFTLLVAVMLSAQCTDERVNKVTPKLFAKASTPKEMLKLSQKELQSLIHTCGLAPTKSKNILATCQMLLDKHHGKVPSTVEALEKLPGVGRKTASVVAAQAFGNQPLVSTLTFCASPNGGACHKAKRLFKQNATCKSSTQKAFGKQSTCR